MTWEPMSEWVDPETKREVLLHLDAAYREVMDEKWTRLGMWTDTMDYIREVFTDGLTRNGLETAPLFMDSILDRLAPPAPQTDQNEHTRLVAAAFTDRTQRFQDHINYRLNDNANSLVELIGKTGSRKSTNAVAIANWAKPIKPENLLKHISIEWHTVGQKLLALEKGDWLVHDEQLATAGEGSRTDLLKLRNMMDTSRKRGVSVAFCAPEERGLNNIQAGLEALAWNKPKMNTLQLIWADGRPQGVTCVPWMPKELYEVYEPWKDANVERTMGGHMKDNGFLARNTAAFFKHENAVEYLAGAPNRLQKKDLRGAINMFHPEMMAGAQTDSLVDFMYTVLDGGERILPHYEKWWGTAPPAGLKTVADAMAKA